MSKLVAWVVLAASSFACGGKQETSGMDSMMSKSMDMDTDDASRFGPLEVGADWATYVKMNTEPVVSETHGGRRVDTYVNQVGAAAYLDDDAEIPPGAVLVKTSMEPDGSPGPLFVMAMQPAGDWSYAIHWAEPPPAWVKKLGGPIYWRTPSKKAAYCAECHDNYDRALGGVPGSKRIEQLP
jgi:hypothetical protein